MRTQDQESERASARRPARRSSGLFGLLSALLFSCGFVAASSVAGDLFESVWWMLVCGLGLCLALPVGLALWLGSLAADRRRVPGAAALIALVNLVVLVVLVGLAGSRTQRAVAVRGAWWVRATAVALGAGAEAPLVVAAERAAQLVAEALPFGNGAVRSGRRVEKVQVERRPRRPAVEREAPAEASATDLAAAGEGHRVLEGGGDSDEAEAAGDDGVRVPFERKGSGIVVPVTLIGPEVRVAVKMLLDTGATLSTINARTLGRLGLYVTSSDATVVMSTANGRVQRTLTVVEGAALGGSEVQGGLTVALCEECVVGDVVGLLGLNFTRHFRLTVDQSGGELSLVAKQPGPGHLFDIRPFVKLTNVEGVRISERDGVDAVFKVALRVHNRSPRALRGVRVGAIVKGPSAERLTSEIVAIPPREVVSVRFAGKVRGRVTGFQVELEGASW